MGRPQLRTTSPCAQQTGTHREVDSDAPSLQGREVGRSLHRDLRVSQLRDQGVHGDGAAICQLLVGAEGALGGRVRPDVVEAQAIPGKWGGG